MVGHQSCYYPFSLKPLKLFTCGESMEVNSAKRALHCVPDNEINPGFQVWLSTRHKSLKSCETWQRKPVLPLCHRNEGSRLTCWIFLPKKQCLSTVQLIGFRGLHGERRPYNTSSVKCRCYLYSTGSNIPLGSAPITPGVLQGQKFQLQRPG